MSAISCTMFLFYIFCCCCSLPLVQMQIFCVAALLIQNDRYSRLHFKHVRIRAITFSNSSHRHFTLDRFICAYFSRFLFIQYTIIQYTIIHIFLRLEHFFLLLLARKWSQTKKNEREKWKNKKIRFYYLRQS